MKSELSATPVLKHVLLQVKVRAFLLKISDKQFKAWKMELIRR